ncbi:MAG: hypothetical protein IPL31_17565 [Saprospiraceae bacterium]|nr:hypothetical protein [Saprospiraceae bacterium]
MSLKEMIIKDLKLYGKDKVSTSDQMMQRAETKKTRGQIRARAIETLYDSKFRVKRDDIILVP